MTVVNGMPRAEHANLEPSIVSGLVRVAVVATMAACVPDMVALTQSVLERQASTHYVLKLVRVFGLQALMDSQPPAVWPALTLATPAASRERVALERVESLRRWARDELERWFLAVRMGRTLAERGTARRNVNALHRVLVGETRGQHGDPFLVHAHDLIARHRLARCEGAMRGGASLLDAASRCAVPEAEATYAFGRRYRPSPAVAAASWTARTFGLSLDRVQRILRTPPTFRL